MVTDRGPKDSYYGQAVDEYDDKRASSRFWGAEQQAAEAFLSTLPHGSTVLDVPVGTGRLLEFYQRYGLSATGVDVSTDMLDAAKAKASALGVACELREASIFELPYSDDHFDAAVCYRLLTLLDEHHIDRALGELSRVSKRWVLATANVTAPLATVVRQRSARALIRVPANRRRHRRKGHVHPRDFWLASFTRNGLAVSQETLLREQAGVRHSIAWLLESDGM